VFPNHLGLSDLVKCLDMMEACTFIVLIRIRLLKTKLLAVKHIYNSITNMNYKEDFPYSIVLAMYHVRDLPLIQKW
jgi:hypothetical protein